MSHALIAIFLWSTLAVLAFKLAAVPPFLLVGSSLMIGGLCGLPWIKQWKISYKGLALGIYGLFGYHFFLFLAFRNAPPIEANIINYLWPLLIVLLTPLFFLNYKLSVKHLLAALLGLAGSILIITKGSFEFTNHFLLGHLLVFLAALIWSTYSLLSKKIVSTGPHAIWPYCLGSGLLSLACHYMLEEHYQFLNSDWLFLIFLGIGPMGIAFVFWYRALREGDPRKIGILSYLTPMLSTTLLILFGNENFSYYSLFAVLLIIISALIGTL